MGRLSLAIVHICVFFTVWSCDCACVCALPFGYSHIYIHMFLFQLKLHLSAHLIEFIDLTRQMIINVGKFSSITFAGVKIVARVMSWTK